MNSRTTSRGIGVSGAASVSASVISIAAYLWLVSLLTPLEMGIIALGYSFYLMIFLFKDFGLTPLVISRKKLTQEVLSSAFTLRLTVMVLLVAIAMAAAAILPSLYGSNALTLIMLLIALSLFLESLGFISGALLQRDLEFKKLAIVDILGATFAGVTTFAVALFGYPLYALFFGMVAGAAARSGTLIILKRAFVPISFKGIKDRELLSFGGKLFANRITVYLVMNINIFVLGGQDLAILGLYGLAIQWVSKPADVAIIVVNRVLLPTYSALTRLGREVFSGFLKSLRLMSVGAFSAFVFLFAASPSLIQFMFNDEWKPVIPLILVLLAYGLCRVLAEAASVLLIASDSPGLCLAANVMNLLIVASLSVPLATAYGAMGCAVLMATVYVAHIGVLWLFVSGRLGRHFLEIARQVAIPAVSSSSAILIGYLVYVTIDSSISHFALLCSVVAIFAVMMMTLARDSVFEAIHQIRMARHPH